MAGAGWSRVDRPLAVACCLLVALVALAGCSHGDGGGPTTSGSPTAAPTSTASTPTGTPTYLPAPDLPAFDGPGAWNLSRDLVNGPGGALPRPHHPGSPGHEQAKAELWRAMQVPGWTVRWQNFTGQEYQAMPKGGVAGYADPPDACPAAERAALPGLRFSNLVATWDASAGHERTLALGAHWDAKGRASMDPDQYNRSAPVPAANDGASGVGILLQLMRDAARGNHTYAYNLTVVLFDGEDGFESCHPLAGSIAFVQSLAPGEVDRFLLLDMVGDRDARFIREAAAVRCDPGLLDLLWGKGRAHGLAANFIDLATSLHDDHQPFWEAGIPAVDLIDMGRGGTYPLFPPYWHTTQDTMDKLDPAFMGRLGQVILATLQDPALVAAWPPSCR